MTVRRLMALGAVLVTLVAAGCSTSEPAAVVPSPGPDDGATPVSEPTGWPTGFDPDPAQVEEVDCPSVVPADEDVLCATVVVPASREPGGTGGEVELAVAVLASDGAVAHPPAVYLEGGPGFGAISGVEAWTDGTLRPLRGGRAVVLLDQRGTGFSRPDLSCPELDDDDAAFADGYLEAFEACRDRLADDGVDLADYTSASNAADVAELREALGLEAWDLMGSSYGSRLALTVVRDHPEGIRAVAIDGLYPPDADGAGRVGARESGLFALETLVARCAADPVCDVEHPDLRDDVVEAVTWLAELEEAGEEVEARLVIDLAIELLPDPMLASLIHDLAQRDEDALAEAVELSEDLGRRLATGHGPEDADGAQEAHAMATAINCAEEEPFAGSMPTGETAWPPLVVAVIDSMGDPDPVCSVVVMEVDPVENQPVRSDLPMVVVNGLLDAVPPPSWAERAVQSLSDATLVLVPERGHDAVLDPCVVSIIGQFLDDPGSPLDTACLDEIEPLGPED